MTLSALPEITKLSDKPDWLGEADILHLFSVLTGAGIEGRFVGGCVRDFLVGREVHDFDIAVDRDPDYAMQALRAAGIKVIPTGLSHGTVTAVLNHVPYELTTLRKDVETNGRHAVVEFTDDWREDAARRDFTMNALYLDQDGQLYDYFGGWSDLKDGHVRFVGDPRQRMIEDALRLLRFFRFSARYERQGFDQDVLVICQEFVSHLPNLATERIWQEWGKLLKVNRIATTLSAMAQIGMFEKIYRDMPVAVSEEDINRFDQLDSDDPLLRFAALHIDLSQDQARQLANALRFSNAEKDYFVGLYTSRDVFQDLSAKSFYECYHKIGPELSKAIAKLGILCDWAGDWSGLSEFSDEIGQPEFPLLGRDALQMGVEAGPEVGQILNAIKEAWIGSGFQMNRDECLEKLKILVEMEKE